MNELPKILEEITLPDGSGKLVLHDWESLYKSNQSRNLVFLDVEGNIIWTAETPEPYVDFFVRIKFENDTIFANSFSCYLVSLDKKTGKILARTFTK